MTFDSLRKYLLSKKAAVEDRPFGPDVLVYKVMGKMFALAPINSRPASVNLKCDPHLALHLRSMYKAVKPGYHMNKTHWNTVILDGSIPEEELREMIDDSYNLVVKGLKKSDRAKLQD